MPTSRLSRVRRGLFLGAVLGAGLLRCAFALGFPLDVLSLGSFPDFRGGCIGIALCPSLRWPHLLILADDVSDSLLFALGQSRSSQGQLDIGLALAEVACSFLASSWLCP